LGDILLLQPDSRALAILTEALQPPFHIQRVQDLDELQRQLRKSEAPICILDAFDSRPPIRMGALRLLRKAHPAATLLVASDFTGREMELYHLGRMHVDGVIRMERSPPGREVRRVLEAAIGASLAHTVVHRVGHELPTLAQEAIRWAIEHAEARTQVSQFAAALAVSPRAFHSKMKALGLVTPRSLLVWGRLIRASRLLERSHETVESVAFHLGYATGGNLSKALKRHVECSPTQLLHRGGLAWTLDVFRRKGLRREETGRERWANAGVPRWQISTFVTDRRQADPSHPASSS
jgi:AraC-like DNA-binding protein